MSQLERGSPFTQEEEARLAALVAERIAPVDQKLDEVIAMLRHLSGGE